MATVNLKDLKAIELGWPHNIGCEGITFINICTWLEATYGEDYYFNPMSRPSYEKSSKELMEWCKENNVHYYGADREDFSYETAAYQALYLGKKVVIVEDFS